MGGGWLRGVQATSQKNNPYSEAVIQKRFGKMERIHGETTLGTTQLVTRYSYSNSFSITLMDRVVKILSKSIFICLFFYIKKLAIGGIFHTMHIPSSPVMNRCVPVVALNVVYVLKHMHDNVSKQAINGKQ